MSSTYLFSIVFFLAAAICLGCALILGRSQKRFENECLHTKAIIVGYRVEDHSSYDTPRVQFYENGVSVTTGAQAVRSKNRPKPGTEVEIAYRKSSFMGKDTWQVHILRDGKDVSSGKTAAAVVAGIGVVLIILGGIILFLN